MRKLIWCCSAAGVLAAGGFLSLGYYASHHPETLVGRSMRVIAEASLAMQPLSGLNSLAVRANQMTPCNEAAGSAEECVPEEPKPVQPEAAATAACIEHQEPASDCWEKSAPIVITEEEPEPREQITREVCGTMDMAGIQEQEIPGKGCPMVMPYCQEDGEQPAAVPVMPGAEDDAPPAVEKKTSGGSEASEEADFKEWMKLFQSSKEKSSPAVEELPLPKEEPSMPAEEQEIQDEPKCQEDSHLHEHYSGSPPVTCPYTGKSYPSCTPRTKTGKEESSEEPPHSEMKRHSHKKEKCPRTQGVDTMEYRSSDGGLNEYGPGPMQ